jgi:hypothetical protein
MLINSAELHIFALVFFLGVDVIHMVLFFFHNNVYV